MKTLNCSCGTVVTVDPALAKVERQLALRKAGIEQRAIKCPSCGEVIYRERKIDGAFKVVYPLELATAKSAVDKASGRVSFEACAEGAAIPAPPAEL